MGHHLRMPPELHLDPERLHEHGRRLTAILEAVVPLPAVGADRAAALSTTGTGRRILAELDRMRAAVDGAGRELSALTAQLHETAEAAAAADAGTALALTRLGRELA